MTTQIMWRASWQHEIVYAAVHRMSGRIIIIRLYAEGEQAINVRHRCAYRELLDIGHAGYRGDDERRLVQILSEQGLRRMIGMKADRSLTTASSSAEETIFPTWFGKRLKASTEALHTSGLTLGCAWYNTTRPRKEPPNSTLPDSPYVWEVHD
jgi:hypothetical protein